ncbi:MAG: DUF302 domain-containing protein [Desulfuromonas sp.]|nr:MAG: DUF302 domain-containing protein [Desulfuromonas sp.]
MQTHIFHAESDKDIVSFIKDLGHSMAMHGFIIHNEDKMEMVHHFGHHGVQLASSFDLRMIQVCAPKRAAESLVRNLERAVLMPKFITVFTLDGKTQVRLLRLGEELIAGLVDDNDFPAQNSAICRSLITAIEAAL